MNTYRLTNPQNLSPNRNRVPLSDSHTTAVVTSSDYPIKISTSVLPSL